MLPGRFSQLKLKMSCYQLPAPLLLLLLPLLASFCSCAQTMSPSPEQNSFIVEVPSANDSSIKYRLSITVARNNISVPRTLLLLDDDAKNITISYDVLDSCLITNVTYVHLYACVNDPKNMFDIHATTIPRCINGSYFDEEGYIKEEGKVFQVRGVRLGMEMLQLRAVDDFSYTELKITHPIIVAYVFSDLNDMSLLLLFIGMAMNMMGFGCTLCWDDLADMFHFPGALIVAFVCQAVVMPLTAYVIGEILDLPVFVRLTLLACAACPGGTPSNMSTMALKGDLSRSVVMTFTSTITLLVVTPYWVLTLGTAVLQEKYPGAAIEMPWNMLGLCFILFAGPCSLGILLACYRPRIGRILSYFIRPIAIIAVATAAFLLLWDMGWGFEYLDTWQFAFAPIIVPVIGGFIGFASSFAISRNLKTACTVMVEVGMQNIAAATMIMREQTIIPEHERFLSLLVPLLIVLSAVGMVIFISPLVALYRLYKGRNPKDNSYSMSSADMQGAIKASDDSIVNSSSTAKIV